MNKPQTMHNAYIAPATRADLQARFIQFIDARPATAATYGRSLRLFFQYLADKKIEAPTREDLITYRDALKENHQPATVNAYIIALRQFFKWTETEGLYPNITQNVKGAKIERTFKKDPLTSRQMKAVLASIERSTEAGARDYAILSVMTSGGLRTIEATRADIEDLRALADETILYIQGKGKDQKSDFIKVPAPAEQALRDYLAKRGKASGTEPLFTSISNRNQGQRMTTRSISRLIKDRFRAAGLDSDRLTAHSLRHTAATLNLLKGGTLDETQQLLRHSRIDTTMIYSHHLDRMKNKSEARIAAAIWGDQARQEGKP
jgi:integrase/recombinase XerD